MAKKTKRKIAHPKFPMQRQLNLQHEGKYFDLRAIFDRLNQRYFRKRLRGYEVKWGRRQKRRPKEYFIFGTIQEEDRIIRINPRDPAIAPHRGVGIAGGALDTLELLDEALSGS